MGAPDAVLELVERFARNRAQYLNPAYNETQVRREFLDPFFTALGWDVDNTAGHAQQYKDVVHEDAIKVGLDSRAPDYSFRIGGQRKFFVEAKKPAVNLKDDLAPAFQLRRYSWSAKLALSVLTDFQEFAVYDGRVKPAASDKPSAARTLYVPCEQYDERWDEIAGVFGKEAILQGSFDRYAESTKAKKGTAEVDKAFLGEIEGWRDALARNIALRNPTLSQRELNYAVQATIDRIIFLRICEDRGIEPYGRLQGLCNGGGIYGRLKALFYEADQRYNSGLFHFEDEKSRSGYADRLTPALTIDDKPLKDILKQLYYPDSPYEFSVLPADILGQVYEQFLGKVIRLTAGHRAVVEDKPEVKKAGGVYYTPTYIVDYIVKHTVGRLLEGLTPKQAASLRILDPACGSGSFLIGAYQYLLDWHRDWYAADAQGSAKQHAKALYQGRGGEWRLTTAEKKRILQSCIFGVDIDAQAVETTKLSLLLKVLEGETSESIDAQLSFLRERALPDLSANIKCGNSLIGPDFYDDQQLGLAGLDEDERYRINVFDWEAEFPEILGKAVPEERRGFDAVIGNPPYAYRNATSGVLRPYYLTRFDSAQGNFELYKFFLERGIGLLRLGGVLGKIVSATFLVQPTFSQLRSLILDRTSIDVLAPLGPGVFDGATVDTAVVIARRGMPQAEHRVVVCAPPKPRELEQVKPYSVSQMRFRKNDSNVFDYRLTDDAAPLVERISRSFPPMERDFEFGVGINTGFIRNELVADSRLDARFHPMVPGSGISRYGRVATRGWIMYDAEYVRSRGDRGRTLPPERFLTNDKILVVRTRNLSLPRRLVATLDATATYNLNRLTNIIARPGGDLLGLLGILNSRLFNWLFSTRYFDYEIKPVYLKSAPTAPTSAGSLSEPVSSMLSITLRLDEARTPQEVSLMRQEQARVDRQIDRLVYDLYGLTDDEIALVESSFEGA